MKLKPEQKLYVRSMGKMLRVTAIYDNDDDANAHIDRSDNDDGVVAVFRPFVLLANLHDKGIEVMS